MQYYVMPVCTPTRSALLTGRHPIHTGMACGALLGQQKLALPLQFETLPSLLKVRRCLFFLGPLPTMHFLVVNHDGGMCFGRRVYPTRPMGRWWGGVVKLNQYTAPLFRRHLPCTRCGIMLRPKKAHGSYSTYGVGKWHLGFFERKYTPTHRGFDQWFGFYTGKIDYFTFVDNEYSCVNRTANQSTGSASPFPCKYLGSGDSSHVCGLVFW